MDGIKFTQMEYSSQPGLTLLLISEVTSM